MESEFLRFHVSYGRRHPRCGPLLARVGYAAAGRKPPAAKSLRRL